MLNRSHPTIVGECAKEYLKKYALCALKNN